MRMLWLAVLLSITSTVAVAQPAAPRRSASKLDVQTWMTKQTFAKAGLAKLDEAELAVLNAWVEQLVLKALGESSSKGGCASAIETQIRGKFEGWKGNTLFELSNGQIWKQTSYAYAYHYAYSPDALIYQSGSSCKLRVEGVDGAITVERLK